MPTNDIISYDLEELLAMDLTQLACQIIARQDLFMPKREHRLKLKVAEAEIKATVLEVIDELSDLKLGQFAEAVQTCFDKHFPEEVIDGN